MLQSGRHRPNRFAARVCGSPWRSLRRLPLRQRPPWAPTAKYKSLPVAIVSSEGLSDTEKVIEMLKRLYRVLLADGIARRSEVVTDVPAHRTHRRLVTNADANRLRVVAEIAGHRAIGRRTGRDRRLVEAHQSTQQLVRGSKHVAHVMKEDEAQVVDGVRQQYRRCADFDVI